MWGPKHSSALSKTIRDTIPMGLYHIFGPQIVFSPNRLFGAIGSTACGAVRASSTAEQTFLHCRHRQPLSHLATLLPLRHGRHKQTHTSTIARETFAVPSLVASRVLRIAGTAWVTTATRTRRNRCSLARPRPGQKKRRKEEEETRCRRMGGARPWATRDLFAAPGIPSIHRVRHRVCFKCGAHTSLQQLVLKLLFGCEPRLSPPKKPSRGAEADASSPGGSPPGGSPESAMSPGGAEVSPPSPPSAGPRALARHASPLEHGVVAHSARFWRSSTQVLRSDPAVWLFCSTCSG